MASDSLVVGEYLDSPNLGFFYRPEISNVLNYGYSGVSLGTNYNLLYTLPVQSVPNVVPTTKVNISNPPFSGFTKVPVIAPDTRPSVSVINDPVNIAEQISQQLDVAIRERIKIRETEKQVTTAIGYATEVLPDAGISDEHALSGLSDSVSSLVTAGTKITIDGFTVALPQNAEIIRIRFKMKRRAL